MEENINIGACKTCKKEVAKTATKCPHCGQSFPVKNNMAAGCLVVFAILLLVGLFIDNDEKEIQLTQTQPTTEEMSLNFWQFSDNFYAAGSTFQPVTHLSGIKYSPAKSKEENSVHEATINNYASLVTSEAAGGNLLSVTVICIGDGSEASGTAIIYAMAATMSGVDPSITPDQRYEVLKKVGLFEGPDTIKDGERRITTLHNIKYSAMSSPQTGLWFIAERGP